MTLTFLLLCRSDVQIPDGIAIDINGRALYWTDGGLKKIKKANLDGNNPKILVASGLDKPRAIALLRSRRFVKDCVSKVLIVIKIISANLH